MFYWVNGFCAFPSWSLCRVELSVWINSLEYDCNYFKLSQVQAANRNCAPALSRSGVPSVSQIWEFSQLDLVLLHFQLHWFAGLTWLSPHGSFWDEEIPGAFARNGTCLSNSMNLHWIMTFLKRRRNPHLNSLLQLMLHSWMNFLTEETINYKILPILKYWNIHEMLLLCCNTVVFQLNFLFIEVVLTEAHGIQAWKKLS